MITARIIPRFEFADCDGGGNESPEKCEPSGTNEYSKAGNADTSSCICECKGGMGEECKPVGGTEGTERKSE